MASARAVDFLTAEPDLPGKSGARAGQRAEMAFLFPALTRMLRALALRTPRESFSVSVRSRTCLPSPFLLELLAVCQLLASRLIVPAPTYLSPCLHDCSLHGIFLRWSLLISHLTEEDAEDQETWHLSRFSQRAYSRGRTETPFGLTPKPMSLPPQYSKGGNLHCKRPRPNIPLKIPGIQTWGSH